LKYSTHHYRLGAFNTEKDQCEQRQTQAPA